MRDVLGIAAPFTLWLASFSAIYGLHGVICAGVWPFPDLDRAALICAAVVAIALQAACLAVLHRLPFDTALTRRVVPILGIAALAASVWTALPVVATTACL